MLQGLHAAQTEVSQDTESGSPHKPLRSSVLRDAGGLILSKRSAEKGAGLWKRRSFWAKVLLHGTFFRRSLDYLSFLGCLYPLPSREVEFKHLNSYQFRTAREVGFFFARKIMEDEEEIGLIGLL